MRRNEVVAVRRLRTRRRPRRGHDDADHDAKMNDADPEAWPADVLARIAEHPTSRLDDLLPWNWGPREARAQQAA
jgi:hypothetical protein